MKKKRRFIRNALVLVAGLFLLPASGFTQQKLAQTGLQFLSVGGDARAVAMGEAYTTLRGHAASLFYNPALMAQTLHTVDVTLSQNNWIAGIKHNSGAIAFNPADGRYGVIGLSFMSVDYGDDIIGTVVANNEQGFIDTNADGSLNILSPGAHLIGLGYAIQLSDRFSVGGQLKLVHQNLGGSVVPLDTANPDASETTEATNKLNTMAIDFGTYYKTGISSLKFGMTVRNYSPEIKFAREGFQLPLTFKIGFSMNAMDLFGQRPELHQMLISIDAVTPRSFPEYLSLGGEYTFLDVLSVRAGYAFRQDEYGLSAGFGLRAFGIVFDFAYTPFTVFDDVRRYSARFGY